MSTYDFPRFPITDMIVYLAESEIAELSESDIRNPNADLITNLFTNILIHLNVIQDDHTLADFTALQRLENPDVHIESIRIMNLYRKMKVFLDALECPKKLNLKDLLKPEADRTEIFLSALLNFCVYRREKLNHVSSIVEELACLDEKRQEFEQKIEELKAEIAKHDESREKEMPFIHDIDAKVQELKQAILGLNSQQSSLKSSMKKMKEKVEEMNKKLSSAEFALVQSVQENANLRSKIVQSPDKLQRTLEEKKAILLEAKNAKREAMLAFQEKNANIEVYTKACKKISKHVAQAQAIQEQMNSAKAIEKDLKGLRVKQNEDEMIDKSLEANIVERQGKEEQLKEQMKQLEKERDLRCGEATKELNNVKMEVEVRKRDLESRQSKVEALVAEVDSITASCNSVKESGEAKRKEIFLKCQEIMKEFYEYSNSIDAFLPTSN
ncbi:kinetochore protein NUF2 homolog [Impatiens glandulifera]|uniref:kinetochore protein NUF2 homolog n=1 Tax=Impatiens glandulifera TaxID=253017 RepID=UPI001FB0C6C0|nr:kinetochore protein NUF2 homolog [Impatiens glandulifera]